MKNYNESPFPSSRLATFDVGKIGRKKHHVTGLMEIDVTDARRMVRESIRAGEEISFNSWLIKSIGDAVGDNLSVQGMLRGKKIISFHDVDISITLEREVKGYKVPLVAVLKNVNGRSASDLYREISSFRSRPVAGENDFVLSKKGGFPENLFYRLPQTFRIGIFNHILSRPFLRKKLMGTVMITNAGSAGDISGWILPKSIHNLVFAIGSINKKPWIDKGKIVPRDILHLTIHFDHDVIDGAPAARFAARLKDKLENPSI